MEQSIHIPQSLNPLGDYMLHVDDVFDIQKNKLVCKIPCEININEKDYDERSFIEQSDIISLPGILEFYVPSKDETIQFAVPYKVNLHKTVKTTKNKRTITIEFDKNQVVLDKDYYDVTTDIGLLTRLLHGNIKYVNDPKTLITMIYDIIPSVDLVHIELIVSNMFRMKTDHQKRCRLTGNYKNSIIIGQKAQPFEDSWNSALAFQYIDKAITQGLVKGKAAERNPIENIISEDFKRL